MRLWRSLARGEKEAEAEKEEVLMLTKQQGATLKGQLAEAKRRLGPMVARRHIEEPYQACEAEISRQLVEVIQVLSDVIAAIEETEPKKTEEPSAWTDSTLSEILSRSRRY